MEPISIVDEDASEQPSANAENYLSFKPKDVKEQRDSRWEHNRKESHKKLPEDKKVLTTLEISKRSLIEGVTNPLPAPAISEEEKK